MDRYSDLMNRMVVSTSSPDGNIAGKIWDRSKIKIDFVEDGYHRYENEDQLARQLEYLGQKLWVGYRRGSLQAMSEAAGTEVAGRPISEEKRHKEFREQRDTIEAEGLSREELICIRVSGWTDWDVSVNGGVLNGLSEKEFLSELEFAIIDLMEDYTFQIRQLRERYDEEYFHRKRS